MCCLSLSLGSSTSWLNKLQMSPISIGGKPELRGLCLVVGTAITEQQNRWVERFGGGMCHFAINLSGSCLSDGTIWASTGTPCDNVNPSSGRESSRQNFLSKRDL